MFTVVAGLVLWRLIVPVEQCGRFFGSGRFIPVTTRWLPWGPTCLQPSVNLPATALQIVVLILIGAGAVWIFRPVKTPNNANG